MHNFTPVLIAYYYLSTVCHLKRLVRGITSKGGSPDAMSAFIHFYDKALLPRSFEIGFHSVIWDTDASSSRIWNADLFAKPRGRYQPLGVNSKINYRADNWPSSCSL